MELSCDGGFIADLLENSLLDKSMYDFCVSEVKTKLEQNETEIKKKTKQAEDIVKYLSEEEFKTKKEKRIKYNLIRDLRHIRKNIEKKSCFGGKSLLRSITKLSQMKNKSSKQYALLSEYKNKFREGRSMGVYLTGRACEKGNRKVNFDLTNNKIIFKASKKDKIEIEFFRSKSKKIVKVLAKLQEMALNNAMPITVRIKNDKVCLSYDEEKLSGFSFKEAECREEQSMHITKEAKKEVYIKYCRERDARKAIGKIANRFMSVDLNPEHIGLCIFDKTDDGEQKIILTESIELTGLNTKMKLSSSDLKQIYQNNKRKHEIREAWKYIFGLATHYKCLYFIHEDLNFKPKPKDKKKGKAFNQKTKNFWHRALTEKLMAKYCNILGLINYDVSPVYSSFIGNMTSLYYDPIAASIEIGRRGMNKYTKGSSIYPDIARINQEKLIYLLGENIVNEKDLSWKQLYARISLLRYRNPLGQTCGQIEKNLYTRKSKVKIVQQQN